MTASCATDAGVRAVSAGDDFDLEARAPEFELLDGGGAEGVARGEQRGFFLRLNQVRELGAGRGLARAVDADDGNDRPPVVFLILVFFFFSFFFSFPPGGGKNLRGGFPLVFLGLFDGGDDLLGHGHAEIGGDEGGFEFFQRFAGQFGRARDDAFDFVRQLAVRFCRPALNLENNPMKMRD